jgi:hypothetical protein
MKLRLLVLSMLTTLAIGASACSKDTGATATSGAKAAPSAVKAGHAPSGAKPGSHEDWCEEHGVPESQCSRCNPALIPAFKATNDWCEEHGLPESQCKKCNPKLEIVRPAKSDGGG